jgi:hypothetical protein
MTWSTSTKGLALALPLIGCDSGSSDDEAEETSGEEGPSGAVVAGTVSYEGELTGSLVVGLYDACPALGPPLDLNIEQIVEPVFPQAFSLDGLDPGEYYVIAALDVGSDSPAQPGPEDKVACSDAFTIVADETIDVNIEIVD